MKSVLYLLLAFTLFQIYLGAQVSGIDKYSKWCKKSGRRMGRGAARKYRQNIYIRRQRQVKKWNQDKKHTWKKGCGIFADQTQAEFAEFVLMPKVQEEPPVVGVAGSSGTTGDTGNSGSSGQTNFPDVDWTDSGHVTEIKYQGMCGSCWAYTTVASIESEFLKSSGQNLDLSEQQLVSCDTYNSGCNGGWPYNAMVFSFYNPLVLETDYPYTSSNTYNTPPCNQYLVDSASQEFPISGVGYTIPSGPANDHRFSIASILQFHTVVLAVSATLWQDYDSGVITTSQCTTDINHAVLLTGYKANQYWRIKNSWSTQWGQYGYVRIQECACGSCSFYGAYTSK